jgi:hypothetical protein
MNILWNRQEILEFFYQKTVFFYAVRSLKQFDILFPCPSEKSLILMVE